MLKKIRSIRTTADRKIQESTEKKRFSSIVIDDVDSASEDPLRTPFE